MKTSQPASCSIPDTPSGITKQQKSVFGDMKVGAQAFALFRIVFSLVLLVDFIFNVLPFWEFLYTDNGVFTAAESIGFTELGMSFFSFSDNAVYQTILITIYIASLLGLLLGIRSRFCAFIAFLLANAIMERTIAVHSNAEILMTALLFWCCFVPLDRHWSIAAALRRDTKEERQERKWPAIPLIAIKLQIVIIYFFAGISKAAPGDWTSGDAVRFVITDNFYARDFANGIISPLGPDLLWLLSWGIIVFQVIFSAMIYLPKFNNVTRGLALIGAFLMHLGFIVFLNVHMFPYLCFAYLLLLIPESWIDALLRKRRERLSKIEMYYDPDCGFCKSVAYMFREFCLGPTASVEPSDTNKKADKLLKEHNSWVVFAPDKTVYLKWEAVAYVLKQSPVFWIFGFLTDLKPLKKTMVKVYDLIGNNRHKIGAALPGAFKQRTEILPDRTQQYICLFAIIAVTVHITCHLPQIWSHKWLPKNVEMAYQQLGLTQYWNLFAPQPVANTYDFEIKIYDKNGQEIPTEPYIGNHYKKDEKTGFYVFPNSRMLKYYESMHVFGNPRHRKGFARYLCGKTWEDKIYADRIDLKFSFHHNFEERGFSDIHDVYLCKNVINDGRHNKIPVEDFE